MTGEHKTIYTGPERRAAVNEAQLKKAVKEAVSEALKSANLIDGPTHIAHHQAIAEALSMASHAKKTVVGAVVKGIMALLLLGCLAWVWGNRGQ
ncbi:MAG: hypothetical protein FWG04_04720 [Desulfovibrionaceae bacterium]|nr:hypothetical protein [Desulfovibrionaceae bacterium]